MIEYGKEIDVVYYLQHYEDDFSDGEWVEKYSSERCGEELPYG